MAVKISRVSALKKKIKKSFLAWQYQSLNTAEIDQYHKAIVSIQPSSKLDNKSLRVQFDNPEFWQALNESSGFSGEVEILAAQWQNVRLFALVGEQPSRIESATLPISPKGGASVLEKSYCVKMPNGIYKFMISRNGYKASTLYIESPKNMPSHYSADCRAIILDADDLYPYISDPSSNLPAKRVLARVCLMSSIIIIYRKRTDNLGAQFQSLP